MYALIVGMVSFAIFLLAWRMLYLYREPCRFAQWFFDLDEFGEDRNGISPAFWLELIMIGILTGTGVMLVR